MSFVLGSSEHSPTTPGIPNVIGVRRCPLRAIIKIRTVVWCLGDGHMWQTQENWVPLILLYICLSICIIKARYTGLKLQGLANLSDLRKDYKAVMMQLMVDRKRLYCKLKISNRLVFCFVLGFFILELPKYKIFTGVLAGQLKPLLVTKIIQHLFSICLVLAFLLGILDRVSINVTFDNAYSACRQLFSRSQMLLPSVTPNCKVVFCH